VQMEGRAAIITGSGTGVGRATALQLGQLGCSVLINYRSSREEAERTADDAGALGVKAIPFEADVADDAACRGMVEAAVGAFGRLDVLINNAGTTRFIAHSDFDAVSQDDWDRVLAVNVRGPFQCSRAARSALAAEDGGEIVNVSSVAGIRAVGSSIPYCASKAALNNLTLTLARSMAPKIRVNAVAPGFIATEILQSMPEEVLETLVSRTPIGSMGKPDDVANAYLWLASDAAAFVSGATLSVDGGLVVGT